MEAVTQSSGQPSVWCVIVNWNGWGDTLDCLASLREQCYGNLQTVVVDNGSTNDSVERIRGAFPEVRVIETGKNLGFSTGCNVGIRAALDAGAGFVWLLNNDTVCPADTLEKLVQRADECPDAGIVGTVLFYAHDPSRIQAWGGGRVVPSIGYATHFVAPAVFGKNCYATFASALCRAEVFQEIGLLYEGFFMYCDDSDFCLRMQKANWKIAIAEDTAVLHKEGASSKLGETSPFMTRTVTVSTLRFIKRHSRWAWVGMPVFVMLRLGKRVIHGKWREFRAVCEGVMQFLREPIP